MHYLVENYRSSAHIIAAANALIAHNGERMKQDHPIRIDRRRKAQPAGGRWAGLDGHAKGRVLLLRVADPAHARPPRWSPASRNCSAWATAVGPTSPCSRVSANCWRRSARSASTDRSRSAWPGELPALHRIREIDAFLAALKQREREPLTAEALTALLPQHASPWRDLLASLIDDWRAEAGTAAVPAAEIAEFCWETLAEQRRERSIGSGVLLSTLHGAKGLEFPHVLIADGGWGRNAARRRRTPSLLCRHDPRPRDADAVGTGRRQPSPPAAARRRLAAARGAGGRAPAARGPRPPLHAPDPSRSRSRLRRSSGAGRADPSPTRRAEQRRRADPAARRRPSDAVGCRRGSQSRACQSAPHRSGVRASR